MLKKSYPLAAEIGAAIRAYRSERCPACNAEKMRADDPFCIDCLERLPLATRDSLRDRSHFIELFHPAMTHLRQP